MARSIVITSGKGGVGKTTVTANLGASLASQGNRVVLLDVDIGLNNLDVALGIENKIVYDLIDVIENRCRIKQALVQDKTHPTLYVMPSCHSYDKSSITGQNIKIIVNRLMETFDYVILDCPAGIELGFHRAVSAVCEAIVVTTPHISSIRDADKVIGLLKSYEMNSINVIINRARGDLILNGEMLSVDDICSLLKINPIGVVPDDDDISMCASIGGTVSSGNGYRSFKYIANNLHKGDKVIFDCTAKYRGFFGTIKKSLRKKV